METRDRDKMSKSTGSTSAGDVNRKTSSSIGQQKSDDSANFGQKVGGSQNIGSSPGRQSGSSGMQGDSGRSSGSSGLGDVDRGDLDKKSPNRGGGSSSNERL